MVTRVAFALLVTVAAADAHAATLTVGPGQQYATVAAAVAAARDGDTVSVKAGVYKNDYPVINTKITLTSVGGQAVLQSTQYIPNEKGILITNTDATITGFTFSGARVTESAGGNGAGIRYQGGKLTINYCYFNQNQNGILGNPDPAGTITINASEFFNNGARSGPTAGYTHNMYIGAIAKFDLENSYSHGANVGHEVKSRALVTIINNSRIVDGLNGTASYSIDLPNGGVATITNNKIEQGPKSQNPVIISFGEEADPLYASSSLTVSGNLIENDLHSSGVVGIRNSSAATAIVSNTQIYGLTTAELVQGPASVTGTKILTKEPVIPGTHPYLSP